VGSVAIEVRNLLPRFGSSGSSARAFDLVIFLRGPITNDRGSERMLQDGSAKL